MISNISAALFIVQKNFSIIMPIIISGEIFYFLRSKFFKALEVGKIIYKKSFMLLHEAYNYFTTIFIYA
jgi:hypothetical protein